MSTRALIRRGSKSGGEFLLLRQGNCQGVATWQLPGGIAFEEPNVGWDEGAKIGALNAALEGLLGTHPPWVTYVGDFKDDAGALAQLYRQGAESEAAQRLPTPGDHIAHSDAPTSAARLLAAACLPGSAGGLCRVYAYATPTSEQTPFDELAAATAGAEIRWCSASAIISMSCDPMVGGRADDSRGPGCHRTPFAPPGPSPCPLKSTKTLLGPPHRRLASRRDLWLSGGYHPRSARR